MNAIKSLNDSDIDWDEIPDYLRSLLRFNNHIKNLAWQEDTSPRVTELNENTGCKLKDPLLWDTLDKAYTIQRDYLNRLKLSRSDGVEWELAEKIYPLLGNVIQALYAYLNGELDSDGARGRCELAHLNDLLATQGNEFLEQVGEAWIIKEDYIFYSPSSYQMKNMKAGGVDKARMKLLCSWDEVMTEYRHLKSLKEIYYI